MTNKERMIRYCDTVETHCPDHLERSLCNLQELKNDSPNPRHLDGCPMSFGLEDYFEGFCEKPEYEEISNSHRKELYELCIKCWADVINS